VLKYYLEIRDLCLAPTTPPPPTVHCILYTELFPDLTNYNGVLKKKEKGLYFAVIHVNLQEKIAC
jgi:hypothetical protein